MRYCARCLYPENAKPYIIFDDDGVCSGCRVAEAYDRVDWAERAKRLADILADYKARARAAGAHYDCIIPVSGGKDSHFQAHIIKNLHGLNPLFVTYNHLFNAPLGLRNLENLFSKLNCDLIRFSSNPDTVRRISRYMLKTCGDLTWHYHCGILTFPIQIAARFRIPLIIWAENNFSNLVGTFNPEDMVEFSRKHRKDFGLRGIEADEHLGEASGLTWQDIGPFRYPDDDLIEEVGVRGIYLSNFVRWDEYAQAEDMMRLYDFQPSANVRERTFNRYAKLDDLHANGTHDYLKYLKFGYGRATDDASTLIRGGRMTREEGIEMVARYDHVRPSDLDTWLDFVSMTEDEFIACVDPLRDPEIWQRGADGAWQATDSVTRHRDDPGVEAARLPLKANAGWDFPPGRYDLTDPRWLAERGGYKYL
ncbi:MAG: N-acetyl sugar amidotransferase [Rhodospirillaceae bacterium]|nr:N-acetyl sugar amidotransferase [Rhodospirillaceae bacterium]